MLFPIRLMTVAHYDWQRTHVKPITLVRLERRRVGVAANAAALGTSSEGGGNRIAMTCFMLSIFLARISDESPPIPFSIPPRDLGHTHGYSTRTHCPGLYQLTPPNSIFW